MANCPGCNKFASLNTDNEPEFSTSLETQADPTNGNKPYADLSGTIRIVLTSECCGDEMREANFDVTVDGIELEKHQDCACEGDSWWEEAEVVEESGEMTDRQESSKPVTYKRGPLKGQTVQKPIPYRFQRRFYGVEATFSVHCPCGKEIGTATFQDEVQASGMDDLN